MMAPSEALKSWVKSMAGCDGGNVKASTWLCGIEWGAGGRDGGTYYKETLKKQIRSGAPHDSPKTYDWSEHNSYRFGQRFSKLYTVFSGQPIQNYNAYTNSLSGNEILKLNLYPIAFDSTDEVHWHNHGLDEITGFSQKHFFNLWCERYRFPYFSKLRSKHNPKLIVCCGLSYLNKFLHFFGANDSDVASLRVESIPYRSSSSRNTSRRMYIANLGDQTFLVCIPFLTGAYGLNSDEMLQFVGNRLRELVSNETQ